MALLDPNRLFPIEKKTKEIAKKLNLNVVGFMCIPPVDIDPSGYFEEIDKINKINNFKHLSMGMSSDYLIAIREGATIVRIGTGIFGPRI